MFRLPFLVTLVSAALFGASMLSPAFADEKPVVVFAAASLKGSLDKVAAQFEKDTGAKITISFASSSALAKQIEAAAPADLFVSADTKWMDYLIGKQAVKKADVVKLLGNRLVLVASAGSTAALKIGKNFPLAEALGNDHLAMGEPKSVPAGIYGKQALQYYGVWTNVESKVAGADNVRAALQLVKRGEAPFGIVYATDAAAEPGVKIVDTFGEESHDPIVYPAAPVAASTNGKAKDFLSYLMGAKAQAIFKQAGFTILTSS
jgi:molybdate transport system substrate-binding protein